ncbi:MAG: hypothetical protein Kow0098_28900 [Ignavibacteriaceae bacterium]
MKKAALVTILFVIISIQSFSQVKQEWISWFDGSQIIGDESTDFVNDMIVDDSGNIYLTGTITDPSPMEPTDVLTLKYFNDGSLAWYQIYDRNGAGGAFGDAGNSIAMDSEGNIYVAGYTDEENLAFKDILLLKYSNDGNLIWEKYFSLYDIKNLAFSGDDEALKVKVDSDDRIYVAGYSNNEDDSTGFYSHDFILIRYDKDGNLVWYDSYDFAASRDEISELTFDSFGNIYVTGQSDYSTFMEGLALIKYLPAGDREWIARHGSDGEVLSGYQLKTNSSDEIIIAFNSKFPDSTDSDIVVKSFDNIGNVLWSVRYDNGGGTFFNTDIVNDLITDSEDNIILTGSTTQSGGTYNDFLTIRLSASGNILWIRTFNGTGNVHDNAYSLISDQDNYIYVSGITGTSNSQSYYEPAVIKYTPEGDSLYFILRDSITASSGFPKEILFDSNGNIILSGNEEYTNSYDIFTIKFNENPTSAGNNPVNKPVDFRLYQNYPNPFNPSTIINFEVPRESFVTIEIFNLIGERINVIVSGFYNAGKYSVAWDAGGYPGGIYFYKLSSGSFSETKKMILLH